MQSNPFLENQELLSLIKTRQNINKTIQFSKLDSSNHSFQMFRELSKLTTKGGNITPDLE